MPKKKDWHFHRPAFARSLYALLANGPTQGASMFGPRRIGKTQFLMQDLAPLAESKGHRVVYVNFWQAPSPLAVLLYEIDAALRGARLLDRIASAAADLAPKFAIRSPDGSGEIEIDTTRLAQHAPQDHLLLLDHLLGRLANDNKPAFLLFDEFQELARASDAPLITALRAGLEKRKNGLVAVFTGSSQHRLRAVFTPTKAPFYRFAHPVDLPKLDDAFVDHQLAQAARASNIAIDRAEALAVFNRFEQSPLFLQRWLATRVLNPSMTGAEAVAAVQRELDEEFGFARAWLELSALQRAVARLLSETDRGVYGQNAVARIETLINERPTPQRIQAALNRLYRLGHADKWDDTWRLADPLFESWIRGRPESEF